MVFSIAFIGDFGYQGDFYASLGSESRNSGVAAAIRGSQQSIQNGAHQDYHEPDDAIHQGGFGFEGL